MTYRLFAPGLYAAYHNPWRAPDRLAAGETEWLTSPLDSHHTTLVQAY